MTREEAARKLFEHLCALGRDEIDEREYIKHRKEIQVGLVGCKQKVVSRLHKGWREEFEEVTGRSDVIARPFANKEILVPPPEEY